MTNVPLLSLGPAGCTVLVLPSVVVGLSVFFAVKRRYLHACRRSSLSTAEAGITASTPHSGQTTVLLSTTSVYLLTEGRPRQ